MTSSSQQLERRGLRGDPRRIGALIGVAGGVVFATSNAAAVPEPWGLVGSILAIAITAVIIWRLYIAPRGLGPGTMPTKRSWIIYACSAIGMIVLIAIGSAILTATGNEAVRPALIATLVGAHFIPFAVAFSTPMFMRLGIAVTLLGAVGVVLGLAVDPMWASAFAIIAGLVQLTLIGVWVFRGDGQRGGPTKMQNG